MAHNFETQLKIGESVAGADGSIYPNDALRQPAVVFAHLCFRTAAILFYVFANLLASSFIIQFLILLTLHSLDLWFVKNVTGRLLVGLRWWNLVHTDGSTSWKFEVTKTPERYIALESRIFWGALVVAPVFWMLLLVTAFFTFHWTWMLVAGVGAACTSINFYGYLRCRWSNTTELTNWLTRRAFFTMLSQRMSAGTENAQQPNSPPSKPVEIV